MPAISVVVPVYNVQKYLAANIESLLGQTFTDLELLFVDDASTDDSLRLLREYEKKHPDRIKVIASPENRYQGGARNLGIAAATGEYIGFCDSDDLCAPDMFETLYTAARASSADITWILAGVISEEETLPQAVARRDAGHMDLRSSWCDAVRALDRKDPLEDRDRERLMIEPVGSVGCGLFRRSFLTECTTPFPENARYEDNFWMPLIWSHAQKTALCDRVCYFYRANPTSTVLSRNAPHHFDRCILENRLLEEARARGLYKKYRDAWEYLYTKRYVFNSYSLFIDRFDQIPYDRLYRLMDELRAAFPHWYRNRYYREKTPRKTVLRNRLACRFPKLYTRLYVAKRRGSGTK